MRIVHITDFYPPRSHPIGDNVAELARRQGVRGDAVHVLAATPLDIADPGKDRFRTSTTDAPGVRVHRMASRLSGGRPVLPRGRATVERALKLLRPDVVHLHLPGPSIFGYDAARAVRALDLPLLISAYSATPETFSRFAVRMMGWATTPVVTSGATVLAARRVAEIFGDDAVSYLPLGIDLEPWLAARDRWSPSRELRVLVHACNRAKHIDAGLISARQRLVSAPASGSAGFSVTAIGAYAGDISEADLALGGAPSKVFPALAGDHDVYISDGVLDAHAAGAHAGGLILMGFPDSAVSDLLGEGGMEGETGGRVGGYFISAPEDLGTVLVALAGSEQLRARIRARVISSISIPDITNTHSSGAAPFAWSHVLAQADSLYALAKDRVMQYLIFLD